MSEIRKSIQSLTPATRYSVRVRAINELGVFSDWSEALDFTTEDDDTVPQPVTGLVLDFSTTMLLASWGAVSTNTDGSPSLDIRGYRVQLTVGATTVIYETTQSFFSYPFEQNRSDFGTPQPVIAVSVQALDVSGHVSAAVTGLATNAVPATPVDPPVLVAGFTFIGISIPPQPSVNDLDGFDIYHSTTVGGTYTLLVSTQNGVDNYAHAVAQGSTHFYKYKVRDVFQQISGFSPADDATAFDTGTGDTEPPPPVTNLHSVGSGIDDAQRGYINMAWDPSGALDVGSYELRYQRSGDSSFSVASVGPDTTTYHFGNLVAGATYLFQVRAIDLTGNIGAWAPTTALNVVVAADTTPPSAPTGITVTPLVHNLLLQWTASTAPDLDHYIVHVSNTTGFTPSSANLYSKPGPGTTETVGRYYDGAAWQNLASGQTYYVKMYAVDITGNVSTVSSQASGTTRFITNEEVAASSIYADRITTSTLTADVTVSGTIKTANTGARMEMNGLGLVGYNGAGAENFRYKNADAGVVIDNTGYIQSADYLAGTTGWKLGASGTGIGLLEVNDGFIRGKAIQIGISTENLVKNSSFENVPDIGPHLGLATSWGEYPTNGQFSFVHTYAKDTTNFLYQSASQKATTVGTPSSIGVMQQIVLTNTPIEASSSVPAFVTVSYWIKMASTSSGNRLARVAFKDITGGGTYTIATAVTLSDTAWHRVVHPVTLTMTTSTVEIHCYVQSGAGNLTAGESFYFEGAQLELSSHVSSYHPASLEIPDNFIQAAYISGLNADKITSGAISAANIDIKSTGYLQSFNYSAASGTEAGYRLTSSQLTFQNGGIEILKYGASGAYDGISLSGNNLRAVYSGTTQFKVDSGGVYIGGSDASTADVYFDTANNLTKFQTAGGAYAFEINSNPASGPSTGKVLRLLDRTGTTPDAFYLTYDGLGYFAKGVIGGDSGSSSNRLKNSSYESTPTTITQGNTVIDFWSSMSTGTGSVTVSSDVVANAGGGVHGSKVAKLVWTTNSLRKGIKQSPWVNGVGSSTWPGTSTWILSVYVYQTGEVGSPTVAVIDGANANVAGFTVTSVVTPTPVASSWQRYVFKITTAGSATTADLAIYFTHVKTTGAAWLDAAQLERGEVATAYAPMTEELNLGNSALDTLQSSNFDANNGWQILGSGAATFNNVTVRGNLSTSAIVGDLVMGSGGRFMTAASGERLVISTAQFSEIDFYSGNLSESNPSFVSGDYYASRSALDLASGTTNSNSRCYVQLNSGPTGSGANTANFSIFFPTNTWTDAAGDFHCFLGTTGIGRFYASTQKFMVHQYGIEVTGDTYSSGTIESGGNMYCNGDFHGYGSIDCTNDISGANLNCNAITSDGIDAYGVVACNNYDFRLRTASDSAHRIWYNSGIDGVEVYGNARVRLASNGTWQFDCSNAGVYMNTVPGGSDGDTILRIAGSKQVLQHTSSIKAKTGVEDLVRKGEDNPVWAMRTVTFNWKNRPPEELERLRRLRPGGRSVGFIAEEMHALTPDCVTFDGEDEPTGINETGVIAYLVAGLQYLKNRLDGFEKQ